MAISPGNFSLQQALNNETPVSRRMKRGDWTNSVTNALNALIAQSDVGLAIDSGAATESTGGGTVTVGGSVTNGNWFTLTFTSASYPATVSPGLVVGPVNIVTADTTTTIATKTAAAINASGPLTSIGVVATSASAVVTVKGVGTAGNSLTMTAQLSPSATITVTPTALTGGAGVVASRNQAAYALTPLANY